MFGWQSVGRNRDRFAVRALNGAEIQTDVTLSASSAARGCRYYSTLSMVVGQYDFLTVTLS
jgi:hypothetical protein